MYRYAFLYFFNRKNSLKDDLEEYLFNNYNKNKDETYILSQQIELRKYDNTIFIDKFNTCEIKVYQMYSIFIVFCNKIKDVKKYNFLSKYKLINICDNMFVNKIFKYKVSKNMTKFFIELDPQYGEENLELMGNMINNENMINELDIFNYNSYWNIKEYKFQPSCSKYNISIKAPNRIEFNRKMNNDEINKIITNILPLIEDKN